MTCLPASRVLRARGVQEGGGPWYVTGVSLPRPDASNSASSCWMVARKRAIVKRLDAKIVHSVGTVTLFSKDRPASRARFVPRADLFARREPDALVRGDVVVHCLEVLDAMGDAGDVRVHGERHHARVHRALRVQPVELVLAAGEPLLRRVVLDHHHRDIVELERVRDRDERARRRLDLVWLIVVDPVGDVLDALLGEEVERLPRLREAGPEPAARGLARKGT